MDPGAPPTEALQYILKSPALRGLLLEQMQERHCAEVLLFHEGAGEYAAVEHSGWRRMRGRALVDEYVRPRAANAINVDYGVARRILDAAERGEWPPDLFQEARAEMFLLMASDCLLPFTTSEKYKTRIADALKSTLYMRMLESKGLEGLFGGAGEKRECILSVGATKEAITVVAGDDPHWARTPFSLLELNIREDREVVLTVLKEGIRARDIIDGDESALKGNVLARGSVPVSTFADEAPRELWVRLEAERERGADTEAVDESERVGESERDTETDRDTEAKRERVTESERVIESERKTESEREPESEQETEREREPETERERETESEKETAKERETEEDRAVLAQAILIQYPSPEKHLWSVFSSPLHTCAAFGLWRAVKTLVASYGMDVDARIEGNRRTALHIACMRGQWETVATLVRELGADVNAVDNHGQTALHLCARFSPELMHILVSGGAYLDAKDLMGRGETPLHCACAYSDAPDPIRLLLESNASLHSVTVDGQTPLHVAVTQNNAVAVGVLLEHGADLHARDDNRRSPAQIAADARAWNDNSRKVYQLVQEAQLRAEEDAAAAEGGDEAAQKE